MSDDSIYRAMEGMNYSSLKHYHKSPSHFAQEQKVKSKSTEAMIFGNLFHTMVLENEMIGVRYSVFNPEDRPSPSQTFAANVNKEWKQQLFANAEAKGIILVSQEDFDLATAMAESVKNNPAAQKLITSSIREEGIRWIDPVTGVLCKAKIDGRIPAAKIAYDLKSTEDAHPEEFSRTIYNRQYHEQAGMYINGLNEVHGHDSYTDYYFIAVEKTAPFVCQVYRLNDESLNMGRMQIGSLLSMHKHCVEKNDWSQGYSILSEHSTGILDIGIPDFSFAKTENSLLANKF